MSRIGRKPLQIPSGVDVTIAGGAVSVKGPKGNLSIALHPHVHVDVTPERVLNVTVDKEDDVKDRALWGLFRKLIGNAVEGVQKPFEKKLEFVGVGYRVSLSGDVLSMEVGFSHPVEFKLPQGITASVDKNTLTLSGIDRHLVGEIAAQIRRTRPPEPYKGKGIKYIDEIVRRKAGKAAKTAA
jgi:large subunit ribosomal protein L6